MLKYFDKPYTDLQELRRDFRDLCKGVWLWLHGDTRAVKDQLKACGCCWAPSKKLWYWRPSWAKSFGSKKRQSMADIRAKYGSAWVDGEASKTKKLEKAV